MLAQPRILAAVFVSIALLPAQAEPQRLQSSDSKVSLAIPADWKILEQKAGPIDDPNAWAIDVELSLPGAKDTVHLSASQRRAFGLRADVEFRRLAATEIARKKKHHKLEVIQDPVPHLLQDFGISGLKRRIHVYHRLGAYRLDLLLDAVAEDLAAAQQALGPLLASYRGAEPWHPLVEEGRSRVEVEGMLLLHHTELKKEARELTRIIKPLYKQFQKLHGKVERPATEPCVIYLSRDAASNDGIDPRNRGLRYLADPYQRRVLCTPVQNDQNRGSFSTNLWRIWLHEVYDDVLPAWLYEGELALARMQGETGRKLPYVTKDFAAARTGLTMGLPQLSKALVPKQGQGRQSFICHAVAYTNLLWNGPKEYRQAYDAFRAACRKDARGEEASEAHLLSLDADATRADAEKLLQRLRARR